MGETTQFLSDTVQAIWNGWQIRVLVLVSMLLQLTLILTGYRRKYTPKPWISVVVWLAYLTSDIVATIALSSLSTSVNSTKSSSSPSSAPTNNVVITTLWVPILLLHLGGPDTITALSLEDNDLWLRHLLSLVYQIGVAFYVFIKSWSTSSLTFITIPLVIVGVIKYGDKTWVLRCSSMKNYKSALLSSSGKLAQIGVITNQAEDLFSEISILFNSLEHLLTSLVLSHSQLRSCHLIIIKKKPGEAFDLVASELSCMYDVLFTKATVSFTKAGILLRCVDSLAAMSALVAFYIADNYTFSTEDKCVTYILLFGAVFMEVYTFVTIIWSDSKKLSVTKLLLDENIVEALPNARKDKKWSGKMAQLNLLDICLSEKQNKHAWILKSIPIGDDLQNFVRLRWTEVDRDFHRLVFREVRKKARKLIGKDFDVEVGRKFMAQRGDNVISRWQKRTRDEDKKTLLTQIKKDVIDIEFEHSLLLLHMATDICYLNKFEEIGKTLPDDYIYDIESGNLDDSSDTKTEDVESKGRLISKYLSDYMLYLLIMRPEMLPKGITDVRYRDTCAVATKLSKMKSVTRDTLITVDVKKLMEDKDIRSRDKSVLFEGCRLAKEFIKLPCKWEIISEIWVEMLMYTACHCGWKEHAQRLTTGGELLTHVALVMAHLGFTDQFRNL